MVLCVLLHTVQNAIFTNAKLNSFSNSNDKSYQYFYICFKVRNAICFVKTKQEFFLYTQLHCYKGRRLVAASDTIVIGATAQQWTTLHIRDPEGSTGERKSIYYFLFSSRFGMNFFFCQNQTGFFSIHATSLLNIKEGG